MNVFQHHGGEKTTFFRPRDVLQCQYMPLDILIEGLLFYKAEPQKKANVAKLFSVSETDIVTALATLRNRLEVGALRLLETDTDIALVTAPSLAPVIEALRKQEIKTDIGKAGAETLAIILYRGPIARADIDRIRGVNSSFILRNLLVRGLVERSADKKGNGYMFSISPTLLADLGVTHQRELTDFARITDALETFTAAEAEAKTTNS